MVLGATAQMMDGAEAFQTKCSCLHVAVRARTSGKPSQCMHIWAAISGGQDRMLGILFAWRVRLFVREVGDERSQSERVGHKGNWEMSDAGVLTNAGCFW